MNKMPAFLLLILLSSAVCRAAIFPLGIYSYLGNKKHVYDNREDFIDYMHDLGYNTNLIEIFSPGSTSYDFYDDLYTKLNDKGIKAIVMDKRKNEHYPSYGLSTGSYYRFEAEYEDWRAVWTGDDLDSRYWYRSNSDTETRVGQLDPYVDGMWLCSKDSEPDGGFAYTDLKYRWNTKNGSSVRIGEEFYLKTLDSPDTSNYIYITYAFNISNIDAGINASTPLLAFMPNGYPYAPVGPDTPDGHASIPEFLPHEGNSPNGTTTYYCWEDLINSDSTNGNVTHTIKIKYSDLFSHNLLVGSDFKRTLVNLNPRLYWYGNCDLRLDYIEIEDQLFHEMKEVDEFGNLVLNPEYRIGLTTGISSLLPSGYADVVTGLYTLDEPRQGQWEAFRMVQKEVPLSLDCMTASYDLHYGRFPLAEATGDSAMYYDHIDAFRTVAQPKITMPDIYPLRPDNDYTEWNSEEGLQKIIDEKLVKVYQSWIDHSWGINPDCICHEGWNPDSPYYVLNAINDSNVDYIWLGDASYTNPINSFTEPWRLPHKLYEFDHLTRPVVFFGRTLMGTWEALDHNYLTDMKHNLTPENLDQLLSENGLTVIYTHFFFTETASLIPFYETLPNGNLEIRDEANAAFAMLDYYQKYRGLWIDTLEAVLDRMMAIEAVKIQGSSYEPGSNQLRISLKNGSEYSIPDFCFVSEDNIKHLYSLSPQQEISFFATESSGSHSAPYLDFLCRYQDGRLHFTHKNIASLPALNIDIYNIKGQKVCSQYFHAGIHEAIIPFFGRPSGIYLAKIRLPSGFEKTFKMTVVK